MINNCPQYLFGWGPRETGFALMRAIPGRLRRFRDHLNDLFSTDEGLFVPNDTSAVELDDDPDADDPDREEDADTEEDATEDGEGVPWAFTTVQFRRTVAWHIAHQPFGVVAGTRQYQHSRTVMFEGYAGTSESGFAAEVASNAAAARLDYLEDLYRDWNGGGTSSGGAADRISAEFERIRRELGDLPGGVSSSARLKTMLQTVCWRRGAAGALPHPAPRRSRPDALARLRYAFCTNSPGLAPRTSHACGSRFFSPYVQSLPKMPGQRLIAVFNRD
ncbi:hypothetical protein [Streptomyces sp. NPDC048445]|uniref:hypothetical protein n=1 Tax=Streptomyces sp. NPDC048445 TaxID=3365553 RepID=UPI00371CBD57